MPRVAIAQVTPVFMDKAKTLDKGIAVVREAAARGAELIAFPETWIPCYPLWVQGAAGWDDPVVKRTFNLLLENSISIPGPETELLARAAAECEIAIVIGVNERESQFSRSTLYNSVLHISDRGEMLGVRRKLMPTHGERMIWGMGDGSDLAVYETSIGRIGSTICGEHWMPLNRFVMHSMGEQIHVGLFPDLPDFQQLAARSYAFEGRTFVLAAGMPLSLSDIPDFEMREYLASRDAEELLIGGSAVIGPDGKYVVEPVFGREEIIIADIDLARIGEESIEFDVAGHYNRPDVFDLRVDPTRRLPMSWGRIGDHGDVTTSARRASGAP